MVTFFELGNEFERDSYRPLASA